ncbi:multidrug resistance transporter [Scheffersomyces xylosifermentans]|uniref:multidrug resistance transporter n=1 Tax=Scheffersomyces xylosifermentans TaxID=1304137 RepID=UPI00315C5386
MTAQTLVAENIRRPEMAKRRSFDDGRIQDAEDDEEPNKEKDGFFNRTQSRQTEQEIDPEFEYSIFQGRVRYVLILILSMVGFWSTVSSPIYFPALPTLTAYFHTTPSVMNLSVVAYLVFQGIAPTVSSNLADTFGRRPVILASILIYVAACIALSQTNVYWLLAVLRCIQAAGIAPVIAISSGVAGDVCTPATRGGFVGVVAGMQLVGNGLGGLFGAALISGFNSWRAIFIFLAIGGGVTFMFSLFFLPETSRSIVGNGTVVPKNLLNRSGLMYLPRMRKRLGDDIESLERKSAYDFWSPFRIFFKLQVFLLLIPGGIQFAAWTMVLTSISSVLEDEPFNYGVMHVGLIYLPQGLACLVGSMVAGKTLNAYYRYRKHNYHMKYDGVEFKPRFNIIKTRMDMCFIPAAMMVIGLVIFGWCLEYHQHISSIIISTMLISFSSSCFLAATTTMLVDLYPGRGSASTSCLNLMRCLLAALGAGVLDKMISALNLGGCYTLLAGICILSDCCLFYVLYKTSKKLKEESTLTTPIHSDTE